MECVHHSGKGHIFWSQTVWVQSLALTLAGCAISIKPVNLTAPQFSHQQNNDSASFLEKHQKGRELIYRENIR